MAQDGNDQDNDIDNEYGKMNGNYPPGIALDPKEDHREISRVPPLEDPVELPGMAPAENPVKSPVVAPP